MIDADALKKDWNMGLGSCNDCTQNTRRCQLDMKFTRMDICGMIDDAPTIGGWISVKDRLPESGKRCLVYAAQGIERHISIASFGRHFHLSGRRAYWRVTHWMPLPEPPEEGKRE